MAKAATRTGASVEALSELAYASDLAGASMEDLETGLRKMQRSIVDAALGSDSARDALRLLGLTCRGTFNVAALQGLMREGTAADRTAKATEQTVKNTNRLIERDRSGMKFA